MNKIGVICGFYGKDWPVDFSNSIKKAAKVGYDAIELFTGNLMGQSKNKLELYMKLADELGIELQYCTGLANDYDLSSEDESIRRKGIEHVKETLETIAFMKGKIFGGVNYIAWGARLDNINDKPFYHERSIRSIKEVIKTAEDLGITYCIEATNRFEQFLINTAAEAIDYVFEVGSPNLKITFDTYHMSIEEDNLTDAILLLGKNIGHVHLGEHNRNYPGKGFMPWDEIIRAFGKIGYKGTMGMEPFIICGGDVGQGCAVWNDRTKGATEAEIEKLAGKSVEFIKNRIYMLVDSKV